MNKKFILNADDVGISKWHNKAVLESYELGLLKSVSLVANGESFDEFINEIIPKCPNIGIGIHLNIMEGISLCDDVFKLTDSNKKFNNSFLDILIKSYNKNDKEFFEQLEREFRLQIEKIMSRTSVTHIDSHVHVHSIPPIFDLVCKLANEYNIKQVRTQCEKLYVVPDLYKHLNKNYFVNIIKNMLLKTFTIKNKLLIEKYNLSTNHYIIGVLYTAMMNSLTLSYGLKAIKNDNVVVEALIHPCRYEDGTTDNHFDEFLITKNNKLKLEIENLGFEITNYVA